MKMIVRIHEIIQCPLSIKILWYSTSLWKLNQAKNTWYVGLIQSFNIQVLNSIRCHPAYGPDLSYFNQQKEKTMKKTPTSWPVERTLNTPYNNKNIQFQQLIRCPWIVLKQMCCLYNLNIIAFLFLFVVYTVPQVFWNRIKHWGIPKLHCHTPHTASGWDWGNECGGWMIRMENTDFKIGQDSGNLQ